MRGAKRKPKRWVEAEHVICHTTCVGVVLLNRQSRIVIEKPIEDVRRLARGRRDHLGIEPPELVGDAGIEGDAGLVAMACIHVRDCSICPASTEVLPALSRQLYRAHIDGPRLAMSHAAATAYCHSAVASARKIRSMHREIRWR